MYCEYYTLKVPAISHSRCSYDDGSTPMMFVLLECFLSRLRYSGVTHNDTYSGTKTRTVCQSSKRHLSGRLI